MSELADKLDKLLSHKQSVNLQVYTLGKFEVYRAEELISAKGWGRDRTIQLFQYLVTARSRRAMHKESILDRLWESDNDQHFKIAMHGVNKTLEPNRESRTDPKYIIRQGVTYQLNLNDIWIDVEELDQCIELGNASLDIDEESASKAYRHAIGLYEGIYLPNRIYEDWSSDERERVQMMVLGAIVNLGELVLKSNPLESIRLADQALQIDRTWEEAYRIKMEAYLTKGNRPMVIKTYNQCKEVLEEDFGIEPLPETQTIFEKIMSL